ncbi:MAG: hypothetical protein HC809_11600, partial [Gammaproteobacteria bacterium]|nr:hypothetical protein [Gammaproteobacteria bacterium]
ALRSADLKVSPAETLDALAVARRVGIADSELLRDALSLALAKSRADKASIDECFDTFFHQLAFERPAKATMLRGIDEAAIDAAMRPRLDPMAMTLLMAALKGDGMSLAVRVESAAAASGVGSMSALRDKAVVAAQINAALGVNEIDAAVANPGRTIES